MSTSREPKSFHMSLNEYNENHDEKGQFSSGDGGSGSSSSDYPKALHSEVNSISSTLNMLMRMGPDTPAEEAHLMKAKALITKAKKALNDKQVSATEIMNHVRDADKHINLARKAYNS